MRAAKGAGQDLPRGGRKRPRPVVEVDPREREQFAAALAAGAGPVAPKSEPQAPPRHGPRRAGFGRRAIPSYATIDLHGCDRERALRRLRAFLARTATEVVLVIHGRGEGILAATARGELERHPAVLEHRPAPPALGGAGARLARLRRR